MIQRIWNRSLKKLLTHTRRKVWVLFDANGWIKELIKANINQNVSSNICKDAIKLMKRCGGIDNFDKHVLIHDVKYF